MEANPAVALFLAIALIIGASRLGGGLARLFKQPRVLGELIIGVLLGPTLLNFLHWDIFHGVPLESTIKELAELGVVMLMFIIGLEVDLGELAKVGRVGVFGGVLGVLVPIIMTLPLMFFFDYSLLPALFAGVTLAATSVSISAQVLFEIGVLRSKEGNALLATALIDDVLAILLVSVTVALAQAGEGGFSGGNLSALLPVVLRMAGFLIFGAIVAWFALPRLMDYLAGIPAIAQSFGIPAFAIIFILLFAWSAESLGGVATITGSFLAGIGLSQTGDHVKELIEESTSYIAYAFLVPIFFIDVGLSADLSSFPLTALPFAGLLLLIAVISKIGGSGLGAYWGGFNRLESLRLGICMVSRGEVGLIVASLGLAAGVFQVGGTPFSSLFFVILFSTLITPILVRWVFAGEQKPAAESA